MTTSGAVQRPRVRLRASAWRLVGLPWGQPLSAWSVSEVPFVDVPLAPGRHVVRVVQDGERRWALKELPEWAAEREHDALTAMQRRDVPAVRPAGLVTGQSGGGAVLITEHLSDSVPWRSLLADPEGSADPHRAHLFEAVAVFLVDLHRQGVFWGDCSLSNLLFRRDGRGLQPVLVDAETAEVRPSLTDGQRRHDLRILHDNLAGGLLDVAAELHRPVDLDQLLDETRSVAVRYRGLWQDLHAEPTLPFERRLDALGQVDRLNRLGYAVDELRLTSVGARQDEVRLRTVVAERHHRATVLQRLTGVRVSEGQAAVLLEDLRRHGCELVGTQEQGTGRAWLEQVLRPALERLRRALPASPDLVQDYCDLLEVRWLLSERAGRDVGDGAAVQALVARAVAPGAAVTSRRSPLSALEQRSAS